MILRTAGARGPVVPIVILLLCSWLFVLQFPIQWESLPFTATKEPPVEVVVASLSHEDTLWFHRFFPGWARSIYVVDNPSATLTVPLNKGREAMVYLSHIVRNYDTLAETTIFVHASRFAWHNDDPDYDALPALRNLNLAYVQSAGYVNLRCVLTLGCPVEIRPHADAASEQERHAGATRDGRKLTTKEVYKQAFEELMPGMEVPSEVGVSCCSQFAASREAIMRHSKEDYVRWRQWLLETSLDDDLSGRVFEYLWHVMFGQGSVFCPSVSACYCNLYGLCDLKCDGMQCEDRYVLPKYANMPQGWPKFGWHGEERNFTGPL